jgi:hypothetical protein
MTHERGNVHLKVGHQHPITKTKFKVKKKKINLGNIIPNACPDGSLIYLLAWLIMQHISKCDYGFF